MRDGPTRSRDLHQQSAACPSGVARTEPGSPRKFFSCCEEGQAPERIATARSPSCRYANTARVRYRGRKRVLSPASTQGAEDGVADRPRNYSTVVDDVATSTPAAPAIGAGLGPSVARMMKSGRLARSYWRGGARSCACIRAARHPSRAGAIAGPRDPERLDGIHPPRPLRGALATSSGAAAIRLEAEFRRFSGGPGAPASPATRRRARSAHLASGRLFQRDHRGCLLAPPWKAEGPGRQQASDFAERWPGDRRRSAQPAPGHPPGPCRQARGRRFCSPICRWFQALLFGASPTSL